MSDTTKQEDAMSDTPLTRYDERVMESGSSGEYYTRFDVVPDGKWCRVADVDTVIAAQHAAIERLRDRVQALEEEKASREPDTRLFITVTDHEKALVEARDAVMAACMSERSVISIISGEYEEFSAVLWYIPDDFSWAQVAAFLTRHKRQLDWRRPNYDTSQDLMGKALRAIGCSPVKADDELCVDELRVNIPDYEGPVEYDDVTVFLADLKNRKMP